MIRIALFAFCCFLLSAFSAQAASLDGAGLSPLWALPFIGLLLSIATGPVLYRHFWEHHYGKITAFWVLAAMVPMVFVFGAGLTFVSALHAILFEYMSFIILLFALYTIAGGLVVKGQINGTPFSNSMMMVIGMVMASFVGTVGASMIMIRPIIRANDQRRYNVHVIVFFIFLVSNIGGALTPLGDPPLFLGFLRGVDFFWPLQFLWLKALVVAGLVLAVFFIMDSVLYAREKDMPHRVDRTPPQPIRLVGNINFIFMAGVIAAILMSATWKPGLGISTPAGTVEVQNLLRDGILLLMALLSLRFTKTELRAENKFNWEPIAEVAKLFIGIFLCMVPVLAMLKAGTNGAFAPLVALISNADGSPNDFAYFWLTGILSSFLDNAPTYLVFFELAGGNPQTLMGPMASTLAAISSAAVFMGANTYIGNAPNFMVYAIAKHNRIKMPSFFGYMLWSGLILLPIFTLVSVLFFG